jgi:hypothetical protein
MLFKRTIITVNLNGAQSYSIGSGQTINTTRPIKIDEAFVTIAGRDTPVKIVGPGEYALVSDKADASYGPQILWYNPGYSAGTIYVYPASRGTLTLYATIPLADPTTLAEDIVMPGEYDAAIIWNLACELAPEYGYEPSAFMVSKAEQFKDDIISLNASMSMVEATLGIDHLDSGYAEMSAMGTSGYAGYRGEFTYSDLVAGVLTVTHNLGQQYNAVMVYNQNAVAVLPGAITASDSNTLTVDLSGAGAFSGTWSIVII